MAGSVGSAATLSAVPARSGWRPALLAYATYVAGVIVATWPLVLAPASSWPDHHDPALFTWVMATTARRLLHAPGALFHGNAFYPYGLSLAFSESLLVPALLGFPGFVAGNPVLTYNLLVLLFWPVNGVAMAWAAHEVTGSRSAAWLAGAVFSLSPYFTEYHLEFNMLPAASVPVAIVAWVRWLERQQIRWLAVALVALVVQGFTSWYYTIILGLGLITLTLGFCALRWRDWQVRRDLTAVLVGGAAALAILAPLALALLGRASGVPLRARPAGDRAALRRSPLVRRAGDAKPVLSDWTGRATCPRRRRSWDTRCWRWRFSASCGHAARPRPPVAPAGWAAAGSRCSRSPSAPWAWSASSDITPTTWASRRSASGPKAPSTSRSVPGSGCSPPAAGRTGGGVRPVISPPVTGRACSRSWSACRSCSPWVHPCTSRDGRWALAPTPRSTRCCSRSTPSGLPFGSASSPSRRWRSWRRSVGRSSPGGLRPGRLCAAGLR